MKPTDEQIRDAAYRRWQHRGATHGWHDCDWSEARQALSFALNYRVVVYEGAPLQGLGLQATPPAHFVRLSRATTRVCRFCEQAPPRTQFGPPHRVLPDSLDLADFVTNVLCEECAADLRSATLDRLGTLLSDLDASARVARIGLEAYKGLVGAALCALPESWIDACQETIEFVARGSDAYEPDLSRTPAPRVHWFTHNRQAPWFAIATKTDADAPMPAILAFVGAPSFTLVVALPLCTLDDDLDGAPLVVPDVPVIDGLLRWPGPVQSANLPLSASAPRRSRMSALAGCN